MGKPIRSYSGRKEAAHLVSRCHDDPRDDNGAYRRYDRRTTGPLCSALLADQSDDHFPQPTASVRHYFR